MFGSLITLPYTYDLHNGKIGCEPVPPMSAADIGKRGVKSSSATETSYLCRASSRSAAIYVARQAASVARHTRPEVLFWHAVSKGLYLPNQAPSK